MTRVFNRKRVLIIFTVLLIIVSSFFILPVSLPLIVAILTALLLDPLVKMVEYRWRMKRQFSVLIIFSIFTLLLGAAIFFIVTKVIAQGIKLIEDFPTYMNNVAKMWTVVEDKFTQAAQDLPYEMVEAATKEMSTFFGSFIESVKNIITIENISSLLTYIPNYLVSFIVYLIALFLFMIELPKIRDGIYSYMTEETAAKVKFMTSRLSSVMIGFFKAQFLVSVIIWIASFIGLLLIAPKVALFMSIIIWIIDLIPIIGSIIILAPWSIYHLISGNIALGSQLAILAAVLLILRRVIEPKVMGNHIGLSPLATLIAMYIGLKLFGIMGFIIGPLILIIFKTSKEAGLIKLNFKI